MHCSCCLHANEKPFIAYFCYCDTKGSTNKEDWTKSDEFDGHIGIEFKTGYNLEPIVQKTVKLFFDPDSIMRLSQDQYDSLNNDYKLLYDYYIALKTGDFPEELANRTPGHCHQGR